jgi:hypothetical protein
MNEAFRPTSIVALIDNAWQNFSSHSLGLDFLKEVVVAFDTLKDNPEQD